MWNRRLILPAVLFLLVGAGAARASDEEGCLFCHRLEIGNADGGGVWNLRVFDPPGALHAGLYCSDCHPDAKMMPHLAVPAAARCIGECHSSSVAELARHRRASFGGLTEVHRQRALPGTPCSLCHRNNDRPGDRKALLARCRGCHEEKYRSVREGVHGHLAAEGNEGMCAGCHIVHPPSGTDELRGPAVTCTEAGCHARITGKMKRLGGHGDTERLPSSRAGAAVLCAIAVLGILPGRFLAVRRTGKGSGS
jgi:hypothetical protein